MTAPTLDLLAVPSVTTLLVGSPVLVVLAVVTVLCVLRARRLDRLHRRTDAARAGLADALDRRGTVALRVVDALAAVPPHGPVRPRSPGPRPPHGPVWPSGARRNQPHGSMWPSEPTALRAAAQDALQACRSGLRASGAGLEPCEGAENTLTRRLAAVDRAALPGGLAGELVEAEQLTLLARRVYNDAVRDTLDLRSRRLVRWLRLAGTAPVPAYFEIADPPRAPAPARRPAPAPVAVVAPDPVTPAAGMTGVAAG